MKQMHYQIGEYVAEKEIINFLDSLQLEWFVKEHGYIRNFVGEFMIFKPPVANSTISVTSINVMPHYLGEVKEGESSLVIMYESTKCGNTDLMQRRFGHHCVYAMQHASTKKCVIRINLNQTNEETIKAEEDAFKTIKENTLNLLDILKNEKKMNKTTQTQGQETNLNQCKTMNEKVTIESVANRLAELRVSPFWISHVVGLLSLKGFKENIPTPRITKTETEICVAFGEIKEPLLYASVEKIEAFGQKMEWKINQFGGILYIPYESNEKEFKMSSEQGKEIAEDFIMKNYYERLLVAGLSNEVTHLILDKLFNTAGLKKPAPQSSLIATKSHKVVNVFYSHGPKPVTITPTEVGVRTAAGEDVCYSVGTEDAFFVVDLANTNDELVKKHVGEPALTLTLGNGRSVNIPFKKDYLCIDHHFVVTRITADFSMAASNGGLNNLDGPALVDETGSTPHRFFANSQEYTEEELKKRVAQWVAEGFIKPKTVQNLGSWSDIEKA